MSILSNLIAHEDRHLLRRIHDRIGTGGMVAAGFMLLLIVAAILAPWISPTSPNAIDLLNVSSGSSWTHPLGTDNLGRDILSRLLWGARPSLLGPTLVISVATIIAVPLAALGFLSPILCAAAMGVSDLVVIGNALRLGRFASRHPAADDGK